MNGQTYRFCCPPPLPRPFYNDPGPPAPLHTAVGSEVTRVTRNNVLVAVRDDDDDDDEETWKRARRESGIVSWFLRQDPLQCPAPSPWPPSPCSSRFRDLFQPARQLEEQITTRTRSHRLAQRAPTLLREQAEAKSSTWVAGLRQVTKFQPSERTFRSEVCARDCASAAGISSFVRSS